ncbi:MAG: hypothetical protein IPP78_02340 [Holophagaceae bacterium]|nr:hypothetical protein [Holophagaceae bacterium]
MTVRSCGLAVALAILDGVILFRVLLEPRIKLGVPGVKALGLRESLVCTISTFPLVFLLEGM